MGEIVAAEWKRLYDKHAVIGDARGIGLLHTLELVRDRATKEPFVPYRGSEAGTPVAALKKALHRRRVHMLVKGNFLFLAPPLCITEAELREGIAAIDDALTEVFG
jgi:taurine--2-oxoglutarate transaminase